MTTYHYSGDLPNRLMESGGNRPFEERAQILGAGPARFCDGAYRYLRIILPTSEAMDEAGRPNCQ